MKTLIDYRTTEVGEILDSKELRERSRAICGGIAWPSKRPGFLVVVAMGKKTHTGGHDIYILDEFESFDTRELVRQLGAMDAKYGIMRDKRYGLDSIDKWIGDDKNEAADKFIDEMNGRHKETRCRISLTPTMMIEMNNLYSFLLPQIKDMLNPERRRLFLKDSMILDYLGEVEEIDIAEFKPGEYPAIEALGFTIIEMRGEVEEFEDPRRIPNRKYSYNYDPLNARRL